MIRTLLGLLALALAFFSGAAGIAPGDPPAADAATKRVGYYGIAEGEGRIDQAQPITDSHNSPRKLLTLSQAELDSVDVLFIDNEDNGGYASEFLGAVDRIAVWVARGGYMVLHDRFVTDAETILPGGADFDIIRNFDDDEAINIVNSKTLVTDGPGGRLTNSSLDGGDSSSHGFAVKGSLPSDGDLILSRTDPNEIVTFSYCYKRGGVVYSSIPLDYYLRGESGEPAVAANMVDIYAPNVVAYGASNFCAAVEEDTAATLLDNNQGRFLGGAVFSNIDTAAQNRARANAAGAAAAAAPVSTPTAAVRPPSTGDAGLAATDTGFGTAALIAGVLAATLLAGAGLRLRRQR